MGCKLRGATLERQLRRLNCSDLLGFCCKPELLAAIRPITLHDPLLLSRARLVTRLRF